jgi:hypothetical protein
MCLKSHNAFPNAIKAVSKIARDSLPADASEQDKADTEVAVFKGDITDRDDIERVFASYKDKGGIWGVIHIAAHKAVGESGDKPVQYYKNNVAASINLLDVSRWPPCPPSLERRSHTNTCWWLDCVRLRDDSHCVLFVRDCIRGTLYHTDSRDYAARPSKPLWPHQGHDREHYQRSLRLEPRVARHLSALFQPGKS